MARFIRSNYSPNQIVARNVARARAMRGWTQDQAAAELAPYLGTTWSTASFSAVERSSRGARVKQFSADELVALARGFGVPLGWFFLPPEGEDAGMYVPDKKARGMEFSEVVDLVLGTDDTNAPYRRALLAWAASAAGSTDQANERLAARFADADRFEESRRLRETFGDLPEAAGVLRRLADAIDTLDKTAHEPTPTDTKKRRPPR